MDINDTTEAVIGAAIEVHRELGPGLLESIYESCLEYELKSRGVGVARQVSIPVTYKGMKLEARYRMDLVAAESVVVEVRQWTAWTPFTRRRPSPISD